MSPEGYRVGPRSIQSMMKFSNAQAFHGAIGLRVDSGATHGGRSLVTGKVTRRHLNVNGVVHGGVYATILDTAMGWAVKTTCGPDEIMATISLYIEFIRAARLGQTLVARGKITRRGNHVAFCQGKLTDEKGILLAAAKGAWYVSQVIPKKK
jgi:uncharacterized protein (TIGR00369 family)